MLFSYSYETQLIEQLPSVDGEEVTAKGLSVTAQKETGKTTLNNGSADLLTNKYSINEVNELNATNQYGIGEETVKNNIIYQYNAHGDVLGVVDEQGLLLNSYRYDAFGNIVESLEIVANTFMYAGYEFDSETGLYYLRSRYYNPKIARFITEDTFNGYYTDPLSLNKYTYCHNNPISYFDPDGKFVLAAILIGAALGAVVGGIVGGVKSHKETGKVSLGEVAKGAVIGAAAGAAIGAVAGVAAVAAGATASTSAIGAVTTGIAAVSGNIAGTAGTGAMLAGAISGGVSLVGELSKGYEQADTANIVVDTVSGAVGSLLGGVVSKATKEIASFGLKLAANAAGNFASGFAVDVASQAGYNAVSGNEQEIDFGRAATTGIVDAGVGLFGDFASGSGKKNGGGKAGDSRSSTLVFGSETKSNDKLLRQMEKRGWTNETVMNVIDNPFTTRVSTNKSNGDLSTAFYNKQGDYIVVDDLTNEIIQVSDRIEQWFPDKSIINPYLPKWRK